jgi:RNA polymerase sigma-70 factor, ECF subfamily
VLEQEWLSIYRETVRPLYGYLARRTGGNKALTEDIVQEAYLRALDHWKSRKAPDSPLAWLKRVARNILIDYLRRQKWDSGSGLDTKAEAAAGTSDGTIRSLEIFSAITSLGRRKARIIEAFYYEGLSAREIAREMGTSERAVEGLLRRARRSLKTLLPEPVVPGGENA